MNEVYYLSNDLLQHIHTYTFYTNITYNDDNIYLSVTKILMYFYHISFEFLPLIISDLVSFQNLSQYAALISAYIITMI